MKPFLTNVAPYPKLISSIVPSTTSTVGVAMLLLILIIKTFYSALTIMSSATSWPFFMA
jgi:hypothetical protein